MKTIALIGLPGSGKTTLGRALAADTGRRFIDLDDEIEAAAGQRIAEMFAEKGEAAFRQLESEALAHCLTEQAGAVLATGGGAVQNPANAELLAQNSFVVFLDRPVAQICADIETAHRPLLRDGPQALHALAEKRRPAYLVCAHLALDNAGGAEEALAQLLAAARGLDAGEFAVIGDPIGHTLSPRLHGIALAAQGIEAKYHAIHVPRGTLAAFVAGARQSSLRGFNVTLPHKRDILPLLDEVDPEAALCGAVNTVVSRGGKLCGHNTDMGGLHLSLQRAGRGFRDRRVAVLGAGGAARAAALKAGLEGAKSLHIAARDVSRAEALAGHVAAAAGTPATFGGWGREELAAACAGCDLLIQATPLGMAGSGADFTDTDFLEAMPPGAAVCDLVYTPPVTALLAAAAARGLAALNGLGMLVCQALLAEELFLDRKLDKQALCETVLRGLQRPKKEMQQ